MCDAWVVYDERAVGTRLGFLAEFVGGRLEAWLRAVDKVEALHPRHVVAGHKDDRHPDNR